MTSISPTDTRPNHDDSLMCPDSEQVDEPNQNQDQEPTCDESMQSAPAADLAAPLCSQPQASQAVASAAVPLVHREPELPPAPSGVQASITGCDLTVGMAIGAAGAAVGVAIGAATGGAALPAMAAAASVATSIDFTLLGAVAVPMLCHSR